MKKIIETAIIVLIVLLVFVSFNLVTRSKSAMGVITGYRVRLSETQGRLDAAIKTMQELHQANIKLSYDKEKLAGELSNINSIPSRSDADIAGFIKINNGLKEENSRLRSENENLKEEKTRLEENQPNFSLLRDKIKNIAVMVDRVEAGSVTSRKLSELLNSIYKEISSLDLNVSRLVDKEFLSVARDKEAEDLRKDFVSKEKEFIKNKEELESLREANGDLSQRISKQAQEMEASKNKLEALSREKEAINVQKSELEKSVAQQALVAGEMKAQVESLKASVAAAVMDKERLSLSAQEKSQLEEKISALNKEFAGKDVALKTAEQELARLKARYTGASSQGDQIKTSMSDIEAELAKRTDKIVDIEAALNEKNNAMLGLSNKISSQLKELANLRENIVKTKLDNARLIEQLEVFKKEKKDKKIKVEIKSVNPEK